MNAQQCCVAPARDAWSRRRGLSLLEVVIAVAILAGALSVLSEVVRRGSQAATRANFEQQALIRCESVMNEVLAGLVELTTLEAQPFFDDESWTYDVIVNGPDELSLVELTTCVQHVNSAGIKNADVKLTRLVFVPATTTETTDASLAE